MSLPDAVGGMWKECEYSEMSFVTEEISIF